MKDYIQQFWGPKCDRKDLIEQLQQCVGGTGSETVVVDYKGKTTRRIIIEYECPSDN